MQIKLDHRSGVPLYMQIKNQIARDIRNQTLTTGDRVPTEREMAKKLGTSRNTVSAAYHLLEQDGYLVSHQGRGTFVAGEDTRATESCLKDRLTTLVDLGLEETWQAGLSTEDFLEMVQSHIREKEEAKRRVKALFVECNIEQATVFAKELEEFSHFTVLPMVLANLNQIDEYTDQRLKEATFIFTTFSHASEVREYVKDYEINVFGFAISPCLEGLIKIARYPKTTSFILISLSQEFHLKFKRNLMSAGLDGLRMVYTTTHDSMQLKKMIQSVDVIIASPGRCEESKSLVNGKKDVIVFNTTLDHGSVKAVLAKLSE